MISNLTSNQKLFIGFLIPLTLVLVNSLMAYSQVQRYHQMMAYEIVSLQESDSIKDNLGKLLETSDKIASTAKRFHPDRFNNRIRQEQVLLETWKSQLKRKSTAEINAGAQNLDYMKGRFRLEKILSRIGN